MKPIDEFEYIMPWEFSRFDTGPGTMPPNDRNLRPENERIMKFVLSIDPLGNLRLGRLMRRGKRVKMRPKEIHRISGQYKTHFGHLLLLDQGTLESAMRLPFCRLILAEIKLVINYRSEDDKLFEIIELPCRSVRYVAERGPIPDGKPYFDPVVEQRVVDDKTLDIALRDGSVFRITVLNSPKTGPMYNWLAALTRKCHPPYMKPTHIRVRRLHRRRRFGGLGLGEVPEQGA